MSLCISDFVSLRLTGIVLFIYFWLVGDSLAILRGELKSQKKHVKSLKKKSLWSKILEEVKSVLLYVWTELQQNFVFQVIDDSTFHLYVCDTITVVHSEDVCTLCDGLWLFHFFSSDNHDKSVGNLFAPVTYSFPKDESLSCIYRWWRNL